MMRETEYVIDPLFLNRWSPRAMSGESMERTELLSLFEAARWAPSANNNQPWRFIYALRNMPHWERFLNLLADGNRPWCTNAAALVVLISKETFDHNGKFSRTHAFDAGAAWQNLALQGALSGLVIHAMQGFDYDRAKDELGVPDGYTVNCMIAVGKPGRVDDLPEPYREREQPSTRRPLAEIAFEGAFPIPVLTGTSGEA